MKPRRAARFALALSFVPLLASAGDADTLFKEGREAATRGDYAAACKSFTASYVLEPTIGTSLNLGDCHEHLGHLVVAMQNLERAIARMTPDDPRNPIAKRQLALLDKRVARVTFTLAAGAPKETRLRLDDTEVEAAKLTTPQPLDPGPHRLVVVAPGRRDRAQSLGLAEGQRSSVELTVGEEVRVTPATAPAVPTTAPRPAPPAAPPEKDSGQKTVGFVVSGVGLAALATGAVTGLMATSRASTFRANCNGNVCNQTGYDAARSGATLVTVTNVAFGVGIVAVAVGVVLVLTSPARAGGVDKSAALERLLLSGSGSATALGASF